MVQGVRHAPELLVAQREHMFTKSSKGLVRSRRPIDLGRNRGAPCPRIPARLEPTVVLDDSVMRRSDALRELMGFARAIVEDGQVSDTEAKGFHAWIETNTDVRGLQQVDELLAILTNAFADGELSDRERQELAELLESFGG